MSYLFKGELDAVTTCTLKYGVSDLLDKIIDECAQVQHDLGDRGDYPISEMDAVAWVHAASTSVRSTKVSIR